MCKRFVLLVAISAISATAQGQLNRADSEKVIRALDKGIRGDELKCSITPVKPFLDFAFRFDAGFISGCPVKEFGGRAGTLTSYLRITPDGGTPIVLAAGYRLPEISASLAKQIQIRKVKTSFDSSGVFVLGEGKFSVDMLMVDNRGRVYRDSWKINAARSGREKNVPLALPAHTVQPFPVSSWDGGAAGNTRRSSRLTILLHAAPINPYSTKLHAWDRTFLLDALASLLRQTSADSVRLIAFNLDQQREIFRQDHFDAAGFSKLSDALERLELGAVSYKVLQQNDGWAQLLAHIINKENSREKPSDTVVFLGPNTRNFAKLPPTMLLPRTPNSPQFFYLEYFPFWRRGSEFPDAIHHATDACRGTSIKIHSPAQFADAVRKVNQQMQFAAAQRLSVEGWEMVHNATAPKSNP